MSHRQPVSLTRPITASPNGNPAAFPVSLEPVFYRRNGAHVRVPDRRAVVRQDTGQPLAVVSDRYTLVPHSRILDVVEDVVDRLDVGTVPRGIHLDRKGARMRALFKFPSLSRPVQAGDSICPCIRIQNTYDGSSRIGVHIGAFRFVCTNLAVGGDGAFAGGFMAVHKGDVPIEEIAGQFAAYLGSFDRIVEVYGVWTESRLDWSLFLEILGTLPKRAAQGIRGNLIPSQRHTVFDGYNAATRYATHGMRSVQSAFTLLERINRAFQDRFPVSLS